MSPSPGHQQSITGKTAESYNQLAEVYDSRWANYLEHTHRLFLKRITIDPDDLLLDASCGTGLLAKYILDRHDSFNQLVLNDIAYDMQAHAKKRFGHLPNISFTTFEAENMDFPDQTFSKVFCLNAFHNYHHQRNVLAEFQRVLKPRGKLFILDWNRSGWFRIINQWIKLKGLEHIATWSMEQMTREMKKQHFILHNEDKWYFRYWKFFYVIAEKEIKRNRL